MQQAPVRKAVFPVAGLGTRFLPATKASPKEMLPVVDKPLIQYAVEEAYAAGIRHMIFVTGRSKRAIEDHFDTAYELENELETAGKTDLLDKFVSNKTKRKFKAFLAWDKKEGKVGFEFEPRAPKAPAKKAAVKKTAKAE